MSAFTSPRRTNRLPPSLMLESLPTRAQPPIVWGRKWTFADARSSDASCRLIQSADDGILGQSPPEDEEDDPSPEEDEPSPDEDEDEDEDDPSRDEAEEDDGDGEDEDEDEDD